MRRIRGSKLEKPKKWMSKTKHWPNLCSSELPWASIFGGSWSQRCKQIWWVSLVQNPLTNESIPEMPEPGLQSSGSTLFIEMTSCWYYHHVWYFCTSFNIEKYWYGHVTSWKAIQKAMVEIKHFPWRRKHSTTRDHTGRPLSTSAKSSDLKMQPGCNGSLYGKNDVPKHQSWLVVWNIFYFPIYWVSNHPNWLSYFSEGFKPPTSQSCFLLFSD